MALLVYPPVQLSISGGASEATALDQLAELQDINANTAGLTDVASQTKQDEQTALLTDIEANTAASATESTLSALDAKVVAVDTGAVVVASSALPSGASTEAKQDAQTTILSSLDTKLAGSLAPVAYDEIVQNYVGSTTNLDTVLYKLSGVTVKTLTFSYDGSGRLSGVVAS